MAVWLSVSYCIWSTATFGSISTVMGNHLLLGNVESTTKVDSAWSVSWDQIQIDARADAIKKVDIWWRCGPLPNYFGHLFDLLVNCCLMFFSHAVHVHVFVGRRWLHRAYSINQQLSTVSSTRVQQTVQRFRGEMERCLTECTNYVRNVIEIQNTFSEPLIYSVGQKSCI